jgi:hypothetical protein
MSGYANRTEGFKVVHDPIYVRAMAEVKLRGAQKVITCPGKTADVNIRLSMVGGGDLALAGVSGEVLNPIYQRLLKESPRAVMITHANGSSGYIPHDAAFSEGGCEPTTSKLQPGCAEAGIVNGLLELSARK